MNRLLGYGLAILAVLFAALARDALIPIFGAKLPFITFYPAVAFAGWFGGLGPGLVATLTGTALVSFATRSPLDVRNPGDLVALALFTAVNIFLSVLNEALHRARRRAEAQGMEARSREERLAREIQARAEVETSLSGRWQRSETPLVAGRAY